MALLLDKRPREFSLDRTFLGRTDAHEAARNWKYGQQDVNVLLLAVLWRGVAIPLVFELLPHGGNSDCSGKLSV